MGLWGSKSQKLEITSARETPEETSVEHLKAKVPAEESTLSESDAMLIRESQLLAATATAGAIAAGQQDDVTDKNDEDVLTKKFADVILNEGTKEEAGVTSEEAKEEKESDLDNLAEIELVWDHSGEEVFIISSFNEWQRAPLILSDGVHKAKFNVKPGRYLYKFIVDGEYKIDSEKEKEDGHNVITV